MDFGEELEQRLLRESCRDFLRERFPVAEARRLQHADTGLPCPMWEEIAAMGWVGCALPDAYGGGNGTLVDAAIIAEEMGRALLPGPFIDVVVGALLLLETATPQMKERVLPALTSGRSTVALAIAEGAWPLHPGRIELQARSERAGFVLNGVKRPVVDFDTATWLLCAARTSLPSSVAEGVGLFLVDADHPAIEREPFAATGGGGTRALRFQDAIVPAVALLSEPCMGWPAVARATQLGAVMASAMMLGACERVLEMTLEHARDRHQFGRAIGSQQAIQHRCADMAIDIAVARDLTYKAAWTIAKGQPGDWDAAAAKLWTGDAAERVLNDAVRIHGAMGLTDECDVSLYFRHCLSLRYHFGGADLHADVLASGMIP